MTVETFIAAPTYTVAGTGPYAITHPYKAAAHLVVRVTRDGETKQLAPEDYSVAPDSADSAGTLTLTPAAAAIHAGAALDIFRDTAREQGWAGFTVREKGMEAQLDVMVMGLQDMSQTLRRVPRLPSAAPDGGLALPAPEAGRVLLARDDETGWTNGPTGDEIASAEGHATAAAASAAEAAAVAAGIGMTVNVPIVGDGVKKAFDLPRVPGPKTTIRVTLDGIDQKPATWSLSGSQIIFDAAPAPPQPGETDSGYVSIFETTLIGIGSAGAIITVDGQSVQERLDRVGLGARADFVVLVAAGVFWPVGAVITAGGYRYRRVLGATAIADLPGWVPDGDMTLEHHGANGDGSDDTAAWASAIAAQVSLGKTIHLMSGKVYGTTGLTMHAGFSIVGSDYDPPTIKMIDSTTGNVLKGQDVTDVTLRDIIVDGNQANQTKGSSNNARGIYFLGACHRIKCENVNIKNAVDHGLFFSNGGDITKQCGKDSTISKCRAENCGSAEHQSAGGAGGSGFVGGHDSCNYISCYATGNDLNGFKTGGRHFGCISYENGRGGSGNGFETGFNSSTAKHSTFTACEARDNEGDGWRNLGEIDDLKFEGCVSEGNGGAGILLAQGVSRATIQGCTFRNNGQDATIIVDGITGRAGIHIGGTSVSPEYISIGGCQFYDDQGVPTQQNHIRVDQYGDFIHIADDNIFGAAAGEALVFDGTLASSSRVGRCFGLKTTVDDIVPASVTGTTSVTILKRLIIPAYYLPAYQRIKFSAVGYCSGTAGAKQVRYEVNNGSGGISKVVISQAAGDTNRFLITGEIYRLDGVSLVVDVTGKEVGGPNDDVVDTTSLSYTNDLYITIAGQLGNASDSLTIDRWQVQPA